MSKPTNSIQAQMKTNLVSTFSGVASTGALVTTTSALNINDGEVAMLSTDLSAADNGQLTATPDGATAKLIQGTPKSAATQTVDIWGISDPAYVATDNIYPSKVRSMTTTNYSTGSYGMSLFVPTVTPVVNGEYGFIVKLDGKRQERAFGQNTDQPNATVVIPSTLPTDVTDYALQTLAVRMNGASELVRGSKKMVILGVNIAGGSGTVISTLVNDNANVPFITSEGVTYNISSTSQFVRGLAKVIAATSLTGASTIEVLNGTTAGSAATVDALLVVGLDGTIGAYEDDIMQLRTEVVLNPTKDFESTGGVTTVFPTEDVNSGRSLGIFNKNRAQLNIHTKQNTPMGEFFSEGYNYLDASKNYGSFIVDYYNNERTVDHTYVYEKSATIYWEQTEPITLTVATIEAFTPSESAPAVVGTFTTWVNANA